MPPAGAVRAASATWPGRMGACEITDPGRRPPLAKDTGPGLAVPGVAPPATELSCYFRICRNSFERVRIPTGRQASAMMVVLGASATAGTFYVVCRDCLFVAPYPLHESEAFHAADAHKPHCPGEIPVDRTKAQQRHARRLLTGNY